MINNFSEFTNESHHFIYDHIKKHNPHIGARDAFGGIGPLNIYEWCDEPVLIQPTDPSINKEMLYPASKRDVNKYMKSYQIGSEFPPIVIIKDDSGYYSILDGAHRLQAAINLNAPILAYIGTKK